MIDELFEVVLADDLNFAGLDSEIRTEDSTSNFPASPAVAEMSSSMAREQFWVMDFDLYGSAQADTLHVGVLIRDQCYKEDFVVLELKGKANEALLDSIELVLKVPRRLRVYRYTCSCSHLL